jgi:hypothetical protein
MHRIRLIVLVSPLRVANIRGAQRLCLETHPQGDAKSVQDMYLDREIRAVMVRRQGEEGAELVAVPLERIEAVTFLEADADSRKGKKAA